MKKYILYSLIALTFILPIAIAQIGSLTAVSGTITLNKTQYTALNNLGFKNLSITDVDCNNSICTYNVCIITNTKRCYTSVSKVEDVRQLNNIVMAEAKERLINWIDTSTTSRHETIIGVTSTK